MTENKLKTFFPDLGLLTVHTRINIIFFGRGGEFIHVFRTRAISRYAGTNRYNF